MFRKKNRNYLKRKLRKVLKDRIPIWVYAKTNRNFRKKFSRNWRKNTLKIKL